MTVQRPQAPWFIWHQPNKGVIARYHLDKPQVDAQLASLRTSGADGISLSPWLMKNATTLGHADQFLEWANAALAAQMQSNLTNLLAKIKALGFNWVQIAPQFYGTNDFRAWAAFDNTLYGENWRFVASLPAMCDAAGLPYLIDVCPEVDDGQYPRTLWTDVTSWFYPGGLPCWNFTMSFRPDPTSVANLANIFRGVDQSAPINPPLILAPHIYANEPGFGGMLDCLTKTLANLQAAGLNGPWTLAETDTILAGDGEQVAADLVTFIQQTRQPINRVCPWPVKVSDPANVQISVVPQVVSGPWAAAGC